MTDDYKTKIKVDPPGTTFYGPCSRVGHNYATFGADLLKNPSGTCSGYKRFFFICCRCGHIFTYDTAPQAGVPNK